MARPRSGWYDRSTAVTSPSNSGRSWPAIRRRRAAPGAQVVAMSASGDGSTNVSSHWAGCREDLADDDLGQAGGFEDPEQGAVDLDDDPWRSADGQRHARARTASAGGMRRIRGGGTWRGSAMPL